MRFFTFLKITSFFAEEIYVYEKSETKIGNDALTESALTNELYTIEECSTNLQK